MSSAEKEKIIDFHEVVIHENKALDTKHEISADGTTTPQHATSAAEDPEDKVHWTWMFVFEKQDKPEAECEEGNSNENNGKHSLKKLIFGKGQNSNGGLATKEYFQAKGFSSVVDAEGMKKVFESRHLIVETYDSVDGDETFLKVGATERFLLKKAHEDGIKLQIVDDDDTGYVKYDETLKDKFHRQPDGGLLKPGQRQLLVLHVMKAKRFSKRIRELKTTGVMKQMFCIHDPVQIKELKKEWGSFKAIFKRQPLDKIRLYFGESVGLYFAWLGYYNTWLISSGILGAIVFIVQFMIFYLRDNDHTITAYDNPYDGPLSPPWVVILTLWGTLYIEFWKQKSVTLSFHWGTMEFEETETVREEFKYTNRPFDKGTVGNRTFQLPLRLTHNNQERYYPGWKRSATYALSVPTILGLTIACAFVIVYAKNLREAVTTEADKNGGMTPALSIAISQMNTIILIVFNVRTIGHKRNMITLSF